VYLDIAIRQTPPGHRSEACSVTYFRMSIKMEKGGSCQHAMSLIVGSLFVFNFVRYEIENKMAL
jgi:hypothetical protein